MRHEAGWVKGPIRLDRDGNGVRRFDQENDGPICACPEVARYKGTGDPNDAASFMCVAPSR